MQLTCKRRMRGFTLIEALIALLVMAFGMLALVGFQTTLSGAADISRQRAEAVRLAQKKLEELRSFRRLTVDSALISPTAPRICEYDQITTDANPDGCSIASSDTLTAANTTYTRTWRVTGTADDPFKVLEMVVTWDTRERAKLAADSESTQVVRLYSIISPSNPVEIGELAIPGSGYPFRKAWYGMPPLPTTGKWLGAGKGAVNWGGASGGYIVFNVGQDSAVYKCAGSVTATTTAADCTSPYVALLITGFITLPSTWTPDNAIARINVGLAAGATSGGEDCYVDKVPTDGVFPRAPGSPAPTSFVSGYAYYACLIVPTGTPSSWSGGLILKPLTTWPTPIADAKSCRYSYDGFDSGSAVGDTNSEHPATYANVTETLESQNFALVVTAGASCPTDTQSAITVASIQLQPVSGSGTYAWPSPP